MKVHKGLKILQFYHLDTCLQCHCGRQSLQGILMNLSVETSLEIVNFADFMHWLLWSPRSRGTSDFSSFHIAASKTAFVCCLKGRLSVK